MTGRGRPPIGPATTIRLEPELRKILDERARRIPCPTAALVRRILRDWCDGPDWSLTDWYWIDDASCGG